MVAIDFSLEPKLPHRDDDDLQEVRDLLAASLPDLAAELLGKHPTRRGHEVRFGNHGSFYVRNGRWYDFEVQRGGDALGLIQDRLGLDFPGALDWARAWLGMGGDAPRAVVKPQPRPPANDNDDERRRFAASLWKSGVALTGTPAEAYLRRRGIPQAAIDRLADLDLARFTAAFRASPQSNATCRAILFRLRGDGDQALQAVRLTAAGAKLVDAGATKLSIGSLSGAALRLPGEGRVVLTEGPEDALSVWAATGRPVWAAMGGMARLLKGMEPGFGVTVAAQGKDAPESAAALALAAAVEEARGRGVDVEVVTSPPGDWNDLICAGGIEAVVAALAPVEVAPEPTKATQTPAKPLALTPVAKPPGIPVAEARAVIAEAVSRFADATIAHWSDGASWRAMARALGVIGQSICLSSAEREDANAKLTAAGLPSVDYGNLFFSVQPMPEVLTIRADVGVGKSRAVHDFCRRLIEANPTCKIVVAVPTKALSVEAAAAIALGEGIAATTFHGRSEDNCETYQDVELTFTAIENVQSKACIKHDGAEIIRCRHYNVCGYQQQEHAIRKSNVVFMSHTYLTHDRPEFLNSVDAVVIDETFFQSTTMKSAGESDDGVRNRPSITADGLRSAVTWIHDRRFKNVAQWFGVTGENDWITAMGRLARVVDDSEGHLNRATIDDCGLTESDVSVLRRMLWAFKLGSEMFPGMPTKGRKSENRRVAAHNQVVSKLSVVLEILAKHFETDEPIGELWAGVVARDKDQGEQHGIRILHCRPIHSGWRAPTMLLDASADIEFIAPFFDTRQDYSRIVYLDLPRCETPYQRVVQITGAPTTDTAMIKGRKKPKYEKTAKNHQREVASAARLIAGDEGSVLFVGQKSAIEEMQQAGLLPDHWNVAWFNNLVGRNAWEGVDCLFVVGRTAPPPLEVEELASAVSRRPVQRITSKWYPQIDGRDRHPDPTAEAIRRRICEGEIEQAIGRARGVNRTADNPVLVVVMNDTGIVPDARAAWRAPTRAEVMAATGVVLESPSDRARCFHELWDSLSAAKQDPVDGNHTVYFSCSELLQENQTVWFEVGYQHVGERQKMRRAWFRLDMIADPRAWLESRLGPLARCEVIKPEPVGVGFFLEVDEPDPLADM